mgnify:CR=1 FL=1
MYEEVLPNLFRLEAPLPGNPLKSVNAWLICGHSRHLLVDNGFRMPECAETHMQAFNELGIDRKRLDFFLTHLHSDHNGLTNTLKSAESHVFCSATDGMIANSIIGNETHWHKGIFAMRRHGFPEDMLEIVANSHPGKLYANAEPFAYKGVGEGDILEYGPYKLEVLETPGHTPGHLILYERSSAFVIGGDHILGDITPNITCWPEMTDALGCYLQSLDKVSRLKITTVLPGHRHLVTDATKRISEIKAHHAERLAEIFTLVGDTAASAWNIAGLMKWNLRGEWENFPANQKYFAVGETIAHLDHLASMGKLYRHPENGKIFYAIPHNV